MAEEDLEVDPKQSEVQEDTEEEQEESSTRPGLAAEMGIPESTHSLLSVSRFT